MSRLQDRVLTLPKDIRERVRPAIDKVGVRECHGLTHIEQRLGPTALRHWLVLQRRRGGESECHHIVATVMVSFVTEEQQGDDVLWAERMA